MKIKNITNSFQNAKLYCPLAACSMHSPPLISKYKVIFPSHAAYSMHSPPLYCSMVHALMATTRAQVWIWSPHYYSTVHAPTTTDLEDGFEPFQLGHTICRFGFGGWI